MFQYFILIEIIWIFSEFSSFNLIWQNFVILTYKKSGASILVDILTPGLPVITNSRSLHKLMSIESVMPSSHLILCRPFLLLPPIPPSIRVFPISQLSASGGPSIGVSASASVLPMNTQDWLPLGWTGWLSLQSKDSQESSQTLQFKSINSLALSFLHSPTLTSIHEHWKNHDSLD